MLDPNLLIPIIVAAFGLLGSLATSALMIRKNLAEAKQSSATAANILTTSALGAAQQMMEELQNEVNDLRSEIEELKAQNRQHEATIALQNERMNTMQAQITELQSENAALKARNKQLQSKMEE